MTAAGRGVICGSSGSGFAITGGGGGDGMNVGSFVAGGGGPFKGGGVDGGVIIGGGLVCIGIATLVGVGLRGRGGSSGVASSSEESATALSPACRHGRGGGGADGTRVPSPFRHGGGFLKAIAPSLQL